MNWQERAEKAEAELAETQATLVKLRKQKPVAWCDGDGDFYCGEHYPNAWPTAVPLYAAPIPEQREGKLSVAAKQSQSDSLAAPTDEQIHAAYRVALGQSIRERDMPEIRKFAIALLQSVAAADRQLEGYSSQAQNGGGK